MCSTPGATFAWVGIILVNVAFLTLIAWGTSNLWWIGFLISAVYTVFLFALANWLQKREQGEGSSDTSTYSILVSLLYGVAVIAIGATGSFLPINLIEECRFSTEEREWTTDIAVLPVEVQPWALNTERFGPAATFSFLQSSGDTLFNGRNGSIPSVNILWIAGESPEAFPSYPNPTDFVTVTESSACFTFWSQEQIIACTDGTNFLTNNNSGVVVFKRPADLFASNGLVWYKEYAFFPESGQLIYSLDPSTMEEVLYSVNQTSSTDAPEECNANAVTRQRSVLSLVVTGLPITVVSIILWATRSIPAMGATSYIGVTVVYFLTILLFNPETGPSQEQTEWWFALSGLGYLLTLTTLYLKNDAVSKGPLQWGINVASISYAIAMIFLTGVLNENDTFGYWVLLTVTTFIPLIVLGILTDLILLSILGALGLLLDAWRFSAFLADTVGGELDVVVQFIVLATAGILIGVLGNSLSQNTAAIKAWLFRFVVPCWASSSSGTEADTTSESTPLVA